MNKKVSLVILCIVIAVAMLFTACGPKDSSDKADGSSATSAATTTADGKYNPPITLTACSFTGPQVKYADGESLENNIWTRAYYDKLGIKLKYAFTSPDFQTFDMKVNMAIASDSLPDILPIYTTLFFRARDSGRLADLTSLYDKYASKTIKDSMSRNNNLAYNSCLKDGKLYAIASAPEPEMGGPMLWIRTDWLKAVNLEMPKNMDDVIKIAKAFANNDPDKDGEKDTFGLAINKDLGGLPGFYNGYHAYDGWMEKGGKLVYGTIQPEMKTALTKLADLYKAGAIDEEFVLKSGEDLKQDYGGETLGMVFDGTSAPDGSINQSVKTNPKAEWAVMTLPSCDDKPALSYVDTRVGGFVAVNAKCKYPEALIKLANIWDPLMHGVGPEYRAYHDKDGIDTFWYPIVGIGGPPNYNLVCHDLVCDALKTGDVSKLNGEQKGYYDRIKTWTDKKDPSGWGMFRIFGPDSSYDMARKIRDEKLYYPSPAWGPETPAWKEKGPDLAYKKIEMFSNIIIGELSVDQGFDDWVKYFNTNGGSKATEEINAWYQSVQNK